MCGVDMWERPFSASVLGEFRVSKSIFFVEKYVDNYKDSVDKFC